MADVPPAVVTAMSTVPADPAGAVAVILVPVLAVMVPVTLPNFTEVALASAVPVMVTLVPPAIALRMARCRHRRHCEIGVLVGRHDVGLPPTLVTRTSICPAVLAGATA